MSEEISQPHRKRDKKHKVGRPKKGSRYSLYDKRARQNEAMRLHLQGVEHVEIQAHLEDKYGISYETARADLREIEKKLLEKMEKDEDEWLVQVKHELFSELDRLEKEASASESDIARVQFRKLLKENRQYLWENFLLPNYFSQLKVKTKESGFESIDLVAALQALAAKPTTEIPRG